ncbi:hypothetical protein CU669_17165 [Paramagnetospirillum kuznetsovii]|uniref:Tyr recombinase domain-containing protein n=2 Tax=Paramagnetospirillum kuznetsovii TaxID=2053833 RepID=A0A364NUE0_9PROT|nr:hypothetical protein CU669_17165 [Paramagnetospirillum kuznetsovii]
MSLDEFLDARQGRLDDGISSVTRSQAVQQHRHVKDRLVLLAMDAAPHGDVVAQRKDVAFHEWGPIPVHSSVHVTLQRIVVCVCHRSKRSVAMKASRTREGVVCAQMGIDAIFGIFGSVGRRGKPARSPSAPPLDSPFKMSARLYAEQGIDAQVLLGHKSPDMTALYRDVRGAEWISVPAN